MMSARNIGIVYRKELLEALRDRRTLISTILVPILLFPILTVGVGYRRCRPHRRSRPGTCKNHDPGWQMTPPLS